MTRPKLQVIIDKFEKDSISIKQAEREREREREDNRKHNNTT